MSNQVDWKKVIDEAQAPPHIQVYLNFGRHSAKIHSPNFARAAFERAISISQEHLGRTHPTALMCVAVLAKYLMDQGEDRAACEMLMETYCELFSSQGAKTVSVS